MLRVCQYLALIVQYVERNLQLLATSASDLPLRTIKFCSVLFVVVVHASCDKQDSVMRGGLCGKLHSEPSQLFARPAVTDPIARYWPRIAVFAYPTCIRR